MKNPKFRIWNKVDKKWQEYGFSLIGEVMLLQDFPITKLNDLEINQFTGLLDKNGKEIYEGDILGVPTDNGVEPFLIKSLEMAFWQNGEGVLPDSYSEVIGNIYEKPELLERSAND